MFMREIGFLLIALLITYSCTSEKKENDWTKENLKGKVKSYTNRTYKTLERFGNVEIGERTSSMGFDDQKKFDEKGYLIESNKYLDDGTLFFCYKNKYDDVGNMTELICYDTEGILTFREKYEYDSKGNLIEKNNYNPSGRLFDKIIYEYDKNGNLVEESTYYEFSESPFFSTTYDYDDRGNRIEESRYFYGKYKKPRLEDLYRFKYNESGYLVEKHIYDTNKKLQLIIRYSYNEKGDLTEEYDCEADGGIIGMNSYSYNYDEKGNWKSRIRYKNNKIPEYITIREIEYY